MTKYVILNAVFNTNKCRDWTLKLFCRLAAYYCDHKYRDAMIIDIYDSPLGDSLSSAQIQAIQQADKIMIAAHAYNDAVLFDHSREFRITPRYLAEFLATVLSRAVAKPRKISLVACESLVFARALMGEILFYPKLVDNMSVTARKCNVAINAYTGKKYNEVVDVGTVGFFHHSELSTVYKSRFTIARETGEIREEEIAGTFIISRRERGQA